MLSLGWSEMLIIAVAVLIFVGPKDLPMMMRNVGRAMGMMRRMSNEFRREIEKAVSADEMRDIKKSISDPMRETRSDLNREFNQIRNGKVEPTGALKPSKGQSEGEESVYDEIRARAGMGESAAGDAESVRAAARGNESTAEPVKAAPRSRPEAPQQTPVTGDDPYSPGAMPNGAAKPASAQTAGEDTAADAATKPAPRKAAAKKASQSTKTGSASKSGGAAARKASTEKSGSATKSRSKGTSATGAKKSAPKKTGNSGKSPARKASSAEVTESSGGEAGPAASPQTSAQDKSQ